MFHNDIAYSIMRQRVDTIQVQATADHLAAKVSKAAKAAKAARAAQTTHTTSALQSGEPAAAHRELDAPKPQGRRHRRHSRFLAGDDGR